MKVAITGANGFVGRHVLRKLAAEGHDALPIVRSPSGLANEIVAGDIATLSLAPETLRGVDCLIHLAARTHMMDEAGPAADAAYHQANVIGTRAVLRAAIDAGIRRFVFMSSIKAIGDSTEPGEQFTPESATRPTDAYGRSKLEAEQEVRESCAAAGIEWVILRPTLVYGPQVKANFQRLIAITAKRVPLPLASARNRRSMVYVSNLAAAAVRACEAPQAANRVLLIADMTVSTPELLRNIGHALGAPARLLPFPPSMLRLAGRLSGKQAIVERLIGSLDVDSEQSFALLNWHPPVAADEALRETVAAFRKE